MANDIPDPGYPTAKSSRRFKLVPIVFGVLFIAIMAFVLVRLSVQGPPVVRPVEKFAGSLATHGIRSDDPMAALALVEPKPSNVYKIALGDHPLWVCYFDPADAKQTESLAKLRKDPKLRIDGIEHAAKVHGPLALAGYDGRPDEKQILEAFDATDFNGPGQ